MAHASRNYAGVSLLTLLPVVLQSLAALAAAASTINRASIYSGI